MHRCEPCGQAFYEKSALTKHLAERHQAEEKRYSCPHGCGKVFKTKRGHDLHVRQHEGHFRYICPHCAKGFLQKGTFEAHLAKEADTRPYRCPANGCGKAFRGPAHLSRHKKTCTVLCNGRIRYYECQKCSKKFKTKEYLKDHTINVHERPEAFQCPGCGKTFSHTGSLYKHKKKFNH